MEHKSNSQRFVNWAGTVSTSPLQWHRPRSVEALQALVREATQKQQTVRVVGAGHSWSAIAAPHEHAVSLDELQGITHIDRERKRVTVWAGTRLERFNQELERAGLALPIVGSIAQQSLAGVTATATHGSSLVHGNLSSLIEELTVVASDGSLRTFRSGEPALEGARVHLGALGIVTRLVLRVEPSFLLKETVENLPVERVCATMETIAASAEYVKVWWLPFAEEAQVFRYERTAGPATSTRVLSFERAVDLHVVNKLVFPALLALGKRKTSLLPPVQSLVAKSYLSRPERVGASYRMLSVAMPPVHRETEAVVPMDRAGEALARVRSFLRKEKLPVNFPMEARFVREDAGWMSPAYGASVCQLGAYMAEAPGIERFFSLFWKELRALRARPHWGKELSHTREELEDLYPKMKDFLQLRATIDPDGTFATPFHSRVLG